MILKLKPLCNGDFYKNLNYSNGVLDIENLEQWKAFLFQNKNRKSNKKTEDNSKFEFKRIKKNLVGIQNLIDTIKFDNEITDGLFLDYSSFVNIFLYFKNNDDFLLYVQDTCEARGEKIIKNINEAFDYIKNEGVVISQVLKLKIDKNSWEKLYNMYEKKQ